MNAVKLVTIFAENKPGQMERTTKLLAEAGINIRWVNIATSGGFGVVRFLVDQCDLAYQKLKQNGLTVSLVEVLAIEVEDRPGGLHVVTDCLARNQINLENSSGFVSRERAVLLIEVADLAKARQALESARLRLLSQEDLLRS
jgi:hypothetical protein